MKPLPAHFLARPFAHRALHGTVCAEHSMKAIDAAIAAGFGIELDIQPSVDGVPMVFHDYDLERLTRAQGPVSAEKAETLQRLSLIKGGGCILTLAEVLHRVKGRVPLLVEIKDQDGDMGPNVGPLEMAVAKVLAGYAGDVAVMSFNPHSVRAFGEIAPARPRGLVTCAFPETYWPDLSAERRARLAQIPDFDIVGADFISHEVDSLSMPVVAKLKARGVPILCWTVRCAKQQAKARRIADQITFEGFTPA